MCTYSGEPAIEGTQSKAVESGGITVYTRECNTENFTTNPNFPGNVCKYYDYGVI
ncbi:MAG: hypothetical protein Q9M91_05115 [Candidatus Dojkabacteria bacterium]|nr:hypothetical protein [Candidatus Dojkabacteria bacterium]